MTTVEAWPESDTVCLHRELPLPELVAVDRDEACPRILAKSVAMGAAAAMPKDAGPFIAMDTDEACLSRDRPLAALVATVAAVTVPEAGGPLVTTGRAGAVSSVSVTLADPAALVATTGSDVSAAVRLSPDW